MSETVKVMVRVRPMSTKEKEKNCQSCIDTDEKNKQVYIYKPGEKDQAKSFAFDYVFGSETPQQHIYEQTAFSLVDSVLDGYNGTIFAYGQTGCGKTFTMMGVPQNAEMRGIIPRTFHQIITVTGSATLRNYIVLCSFVQIYNEEIHDLLGKDIKAKMDLKESPQDGVFIDQLTKIPVKTTAEMERYMDLGFKNRAVRETEMNKQSSRSHSLFTISIESFETNTDKAPQKIKSGKLNLVDLAGSQRQSKTNVTGQGLKEATKINLSLSALGNVISALVVGKGAFVPYRDSKLTRLLQDSLGGNTKTIMIAALSPAHYNYEQSLSTLRYASRAKFIQNKPRVNEDPREAQLRQYADEIKRLKLMLEGKLPPEIKNTIVLENKQNSSELEQELKKKELLLLAEKEERAKLAAQLQNLQKMVSKEAPNSNNEQELEKIKKLSEKLKEQKRKEEQYLEQKKRTQDQLLNIEKNYRGLNSQVDQMRQRFKDLKKKYVLSLTELRDIQIEHENDKEELLDTVRFQEKEIKRLQAILDVLMTPEQINQISDMSEWNEEKREYIVPAFTYRQRNINFPKLSSQQTKDLLENQKNKKEVYFKDNPIDTKRGSMGDITEERSPWKNKPPRMGGDPGMRLNYIVRDARQGNLDVSQGSATARSNSISRQMQLTPIKNATVGDMDKLKERESSTGSMFEKGKKLDPIMRISGDDTFRQSMERYK